MTDEIDALLNSYHTTTLWTMADAAGLQVTQGNKKLKKKDLIPKMRAEFFTQERVRSSWDKLNQTERQVLNRLLLHGGQVTRKTFQREIIRAGLATQAPEIEKPKNPYRYYYGTPYARNVYNGDPQRKNSRIFDDVIARLTYHGLVFSRGTPATTGNTPFKIQFHPAATLYVPAAVRRYLPDPEPIPPPLANWKPTRVESGTPDLLLRDMYIYWDMVRRNNIALIKSGLVSKRWLKTINQALLSPDPLVKEAMRETQTGRLHLLRQLLMKCKLVHSGRKTLRPTGEGPLHIPDFWGLGQAQQLKLCITAWVALDEPTELPDGAPVYNPLYRHARQAVLDALKKTHTGGEWLEIDNFVTQIQAQDANFLFAAHSDIENHLGRRYYNYSYGYYYQNPQDLLEILEQFEAAFVTRCLTGFLYQSGTVELGYDGDALKGFRLTPTGMMALGMNPARPPQDETGKLIVQPNFQLLALGPVSLALLAQLDLFAEREGADIGAFDYRLSRESVYRAQQMGMEAKDILHFLEQNSETDLPQNVRRSLDEWGASHERIIFRTGVSLLQAASADMLARLIQEPRTGAYIARPVTDDVALLKKDGQKHLIAALVEQGLFPAVSGVQAEASDHSVIVHQDGTIHAIHAVPSLHLRRRLSRLAEESGKGEWKLTPASIRRAGGNRTKVLQVLEELNKLNRGPLPDQLTGQIKAWGNYYGNARAEMLTLIEFHDQAILQELTTHPDLQPYLTPFSTQDRALAVVRAENLPQVKKILSLLGVQVQDKITPS